MWRWLVIDTALSARAAEMRQGFDASFAAAARTGETASEALLAIAVGDRPRAIRLADIAELVTGRPITPLAGPVPELLGIIGLRGTLVPTFDLAALLGEADRAPRRWLVVTAAAPRFALAFSRMDGHVQVPAAAIARDPATGREVVTVDGVLRPLIEVAALAARLAQRREAP
jgi:chemotaxis signal transduction protein